MTAVETAKLHIKFILFVKLVFYDLSNQVFLNAFFFINFIIMYIIF